MANVSDSLCCANGPIALSNVNRLQRNLPRLIRTFYALSRDQVGDLGITVLQGYTLTGLHINGPMTMSEISDYTQLSVSTMTRVIDKLVKAGLVERMCNANDRRVVWLKLTAAGAAKSAEFRQVQGLFFRQVLAGLSANDQATVVSGLTLLAECLGQLLAQNGHLETVAPGSMPLEPVA